MLKLTLRTNHVTRSSTTVILECLAIYSQALMCGNLHVAWQWKGRAKIFVGLTGACCLRRLCVNGVIKPWAKVVITQCFVSVADWFCNPSSVGTTSIAFSLATFRTIWTQTSNETHGANDGNICFDILSTSWYPRNPLQYQSSKREEKLDIWKYQIL